MKLTYIEKLVLIGMVCVALILVYIIVYLAFQKDPFKPEEELSMFKGIKKGNNEKGNGKGNNGKTYTANTMITSENAGIQMWNELAREIAENYDNYTRFIVQTQRDLIPVTSSVLSFMFENLSKAVIFTDIMTKQYMYKLKTVNIPEVCVYDGETLKRAVRTSIIPTDAGFYSNYSDLAYNNALKVNVNGKFEAKYLKIDLNVPFLDISDVNSDLVGKVQGVVLVTNGAMPIVEKFQKSLNYISKLLEMNTPVVVSSLFGNPYDIPQELMQKKGVIIAGDIPATAAYAKMLFLLSYVEDTSLIPQLFVQSLRGETDGVNLGEVVEIKEKNADPGFISDVSVSELDEIPYVA